MTFLDDDPRRVEIRADLSRLRGDLAEAGRAIAELAEPAKEAAIQIEKSFSVSFRSFGSTLEGVLRGGRASFRDFTNAILSDLTRTAVQSVVTKPLSGFLNQLVGSVIGFGGGRAIGGPVAPGTAYLVGERGPELFVPSTNGLIDQPGAGQRGAAPTIVFNVQARDAESFRRSETQIAAMLNRAVARGTRNR